MTKRVGAAAELKARVLLAIYGKRLEALAEKHDLDFADFDTQIVEALTAIGIKVGKKKRAQFFIDLERLFGLTAREFEALFECAIDVSVDYYDELVEWVAEGNDRLIERDRRSFRLGQYHDPAFQMCGDRAYPGDMTFFLAYGGVPLVCKWACYSARGCSITAHGVSATEFLNELKRRVAARLVKRFKGKIVTHQLAEVALKLYDRDQLVYPAKLGRTIDRMLVAFANWYESTKINRWGYLLIGGPGTGKTTLGGLLANARPQGCTFMYCPAGEIAQPSAIADIFYHARILGPTILHVDDIDLISQDRKQKDSVGFTSALMEQLDGLSAEGKIFVVMTTNDPSGIEQAIINRAGRISDKILFSGFGECLPQLLERYSKEYSLGLSEKAIVAAIRKCNKVAAAKLTPDDARNICERLALHRRSGAEAISVDDIATSIKEVCVAFHDQKMNKSCLEWKRTAATKKAENSGPMDY